MRRTLSALAAAVLVAVVAAGPALADENADEQEDQGSEGAESQESCNVTIAEQCIWIIDPIENPFQDQVEETRNRIERQLQPATCRASGHMTNVPQTNYAYAYASGQCSRAIEAIFVEFVLAPLNGAPVPGSAFCDSCSGVSTITHYAYDQSPIIHCFSYHGDAEFWGGTPASATLGPEWGCN